VRGFLGLAFGCVLALGAVVFARGQQTPALAKPDLTNPAAFTETAPAVYRVRLETTVATVLIEVTRAWAPHAADRFYNLVKAGYYDQCRFYRVLPGYVAQFGIHGDPAVNAAWARAMLPPDRAWKANTRGRVTFAMAQLVTTRSTQVFINFGNNSRLDLDGFAPFGQVVAGLAPLELLFSQYGEGPDPRRFFAEGHAFLFKIMPQLDYIKTARLDP
jgi:peptidyl-prolyl cis-trans isomerase A (cyclophilin A)